MDNICEGRADKMKQIGNHIRKHFSINLLPNSCSYCYCYFVTKTVTWRHLDNQAWYHRSAGVKMTRKKIQIKNQNEFDNNEKNAQFSKECLIFQKNPLFTKVAHFKKMPYFHQDCRRCSILPSRMREHGVSLENMENMENMENINQMTKKSPEEF